MTIYEAMGMAGAVMAACSAVMALLFSYLWLAGRLLDLAMMCSRRKGAVVIVGGMAAPIFIILTIAFFIMGAMA